MSDMQKTERFSFGNPSSLNYGDQPYRDTMTLNRLRAAGSGMDAVDKYKHTRYFYRIKICRDVKKAGHVDPLSVDIDGWNRQCFPCDQTSPGTSWDIMEAIRPYRRFSPRRLFYILCATLPALSLQPVISSGRDPPISQTQQGVIAFPLCQRKTLTGGNLLGI